LNISKNLLNKTYKEICNKAEEISSFLSNDYNTNITFGNKNWEKQNGNWICNYFPIPVIEINNKIDLNINMFDKPYYFEFFIKRNRLKNFDIEKLISLFKNNNLSIYGGKDCLIDFYFANSPLNEILTNMLNSKEKSFGFSFETSKDKKLIEGDLHKLLNCYDE